MKKIYKKVLFIAFILLFSFFIKSSEVNAAECSISANTTSPTQGQTVQVTGSVTAGAWNVVLAGAGQSQTIFGYTTTNANATASKTISFVAGAPGTTYTITLEGDMTDISATSAEAVNKSITISVVNSQANNQNGGNNAGTTTNNNDNTATKKSNNANLKNLGIRPNDFKGFKAGTTTYDVTVPEDVEKVEVYAYAQDSKATVTGTGTKTLQKGANALQVTVTAEDGTTKKVYTINVTRQESQNNEDEEKPEEIQENTQEVEEGKGISQLTISNVTLDPEFKTDVYEYTAKYIGDLTSLDIKADPTDIGYNVEIIGNEELKEGENLVTILVSDADGNNVATYQITINKSLVDYEAIERENQEKQKLIKIGIIVVAIVVIAIIAFIIIRRRRNREWEYEEDDYDEYDNENDIQNQNNQVEPFSGVQDEEYNKIQEDLNKENNEIQEQDEYYEEEIVKKPKHKAKRYK